MKKVLFFIILLSSVLFSCKFQNKSAYNYFDNYFEFGNDSGKVVIHVFFPEGCKSCNRSFVSELKNKEINNNEYFLLISHYPYCESQIELTQTFKSKFGNHFAIDSTDLYLKYKDIPACTGCFNLTLQPE